MSLSDTEQELRKARVKLVCAEDDAKYQKGEADRLRAELIKTAKERDAAEALVADGGVSAVRLDEVLAAFPKCQAVQCETNARLRLRGLLDYCQEHADYLKSPENRELLSPVAWLPALEAVEKLRAAVAAAPAGQAAGTVESHEPHSAILEDFGLRWVRYPKSPSEPGSWELELGSFGSVWDNGVWHTWDDRGIGGENAEEESVEAAKAAVEESLIRQERSPIKGWHPHGFDLEIGDDEDEAPQLMQLPVSGEAKEER